MKPIGGGWHDFNNYFDDYLKSHPEAWEALADKLWGNFVNYKNIPFGSKEIWHERKN